MVLETLELCDLPASDSVGPPALLSGVQAPAPLSTQTGMVLAAMAPPLKAKWEAGDGTYGCANPPAPRQDDKHGKRAGLEAGPFQSGMVRVGYSTISELSSGAER